MLVLVGLDQGHPDDTSTVLHIYDQAVFIAADIENDAIVAADAGAMARVDRQLPYGPANDLASDGQQLQLPSPSAGSRATASV